MQAMITQPICCRVRALALVLASLLGTNVAYAQMPPANTDVQNARISQTSDSLAMNDFADTPMPDQQGRERASAVPWSQLSSDQRSMLAPLQPQWDQLPPRRQRRLAERSQEWAQLPQDRRRMIGERLQRWAQMSPQQRQAAARGANAFHGLPNADRQRLMQAYQRFQTLPPERRRALMQQWRAQRVGNHGMRTHAPLPDNSQPGR